MARITRLDDYRQHGSDQDSAIELLLADARLRLVETGTRNRLVSTPRTSKRTRSLPVLNADADALFAALTTAARTFRFTPADPAKTGERDAEGAGATTKVLPLRTRSPAGNGLQTNVTADVLEKRLLSIFRDARTAEEEQGINILFLAIGFLRWYEDDSSDVLREAPLVLVPVSMVRDPKRATFELRARDEDIATNQAIQERLRADFGIALPELPESDEWSPSDYFADVRDAIEGKPRWSIDEDGIEMGFYSFSKLLMIRDLEPDQWGEQSLVAHPILRGLLADGFAREAPVVENDADLDAQFAPAELIQVVDADSSQTVVIETVRAGGNLVVQGPPGTGKSQTITNVIAAAVHDGKKVLFVAEKMAALNVVHERLRKVGLGPVCLELHSKGANKKNVLAELDATLRHSAAAQDDSAAVARLTVVREALNAAAHRLHRPVGDTGLTPYQTLSRLIAATHDGDIGHPPLLAEARRWSAGKYRAVVEANERLCETMADSGPLLRHPYCGVRATKLQPAEIARLLPELAELAAASEALALRLESAAGAVRVGGMDSLSAVPAMVEVLSAAASLSPKAREFAHAMAGKDAVRVIESADGGISWAALKNTHKATFNEAAWATAAMPMRAGIVSGLSFLGRLGGQYRQASTLLSTLLSGPLPKKAQERLALVDILASIQSAREAALRDEAVMAALLPQHWRGERTDFVTLKAAAEAVKFLAESELRPNVLRAVEASRVIDPEAVAEITRGAADVKGRLDGVLATLDFELMPDFGFEAWDLRALAEQVNTWRDSHQRYDEWRRLVAADRRLRECSAAPLANALAKGTVLPENSRAILDCTFAEAVWSRAVAAEPSLQEFHGRRHDALVSEFGSLEADRRRSTVDIVLARHSAGMPRGSLGQMNVLRSEIARKRGHMPIRKLFMNCGETLQRLKPVLLMSPISVAQFLAPGAVEFDLLVIDEASQVRPEEALGLVARAKQIVVVGDSKQLPPTSFFDRVVADEEEGEDDDAATLLAGAAKATDQESILKLCEARGLNSAMLRWHYRSRHPSLIEVSNAEFYRRLIMPPAPSTERTDVGMVMRRVVGSYDRGGKRINAVEAEAVVEAVAAHAGKNPDVSLGVVTFSSAQRDAIDDLLAIRRRGDPALDEFLNEGRDEDFFVKNLENVQGDERDVILVSVGYGPRVAGSRLDSMAFGPVSSEGGERRLNVLFTRARSRCEIFASFSAADIDPDRAKGEGARVFKRFLQFAETGILEERVSASDYADSPFEETVASVIEGFGYKVDKQVGSAGFKIDLAVRSPEQPGRYILAVECDGAAYHGSLWARERDRMRQEVLENMGWKFHRIWSTDWFYRNGEAIQRLRTAIGEARIAAPKAVAARRREALPAASGPALDIKAPPYLVANVKGPAGVDPGGMDASSLAIMAMRIVEVEGPIHGDEIARRVAGAFGKQRAGPQINAATMRALRHLRSRSGIDQDHGFWMTQSQARATPVRDRSAAPPSVQKVDMLSPLEIVAAAKMAETENGALTDEEMTTAVSRLLGYKRTGVELRAAIEETLKAQEQASLEPNRPRA